MGCMNIVIFLIQHQASPDEATVRGETPLHLAARANQTDIIRILLRNGAQVDARARVCICTILTQGINICNSLLRVCFVLLSRHIMTGFFFVLIVLFCIIFL